MKIERIATSHFNKYDWHFNLIPYFNFGNNEWKKNECIINLGWAFWNLYLRISFN